MNKPVLLIRGAGNESDATALSQLGITSLIDPYLEIAVSVEKADAMNMYNFLCDTEEPLWLIATSTNAIKYWAEIVGADEITAALSVKRDLRFAAIGEATAAALIALGARQVLTPQSANSDSLITALVEYPPSTAIIPGGNLAMAQLPSALRSSGWTLKTGVVYTTSPIEVEPRSVPLLQNGEIAAVLIRSPSAARALLARVPHPNIPIVCAGQTTSRAVEALGIRVAAVAEDPTPGAVAATIVSVLTK